MPMNWTNYDWDPQTEMASFTDEDTWKTTTIHQPLRPVVDVATYFKKLQQTLRGEKP